MNNMTRSHPWATNSDIDQGDLHTPDAALGASETRHDSFASPEGSGTVQIRQFSTADDEVFQDARSHNHEDAMISDEMNIDFARVPESADNASTTRLIGATSTERVQIPHHRSRQGETNSDPLKKLKEVVTKVRIAQSMASLASVWRSDVTRDQHLCSSCFDLNLTAGSFVIDSGQAGDIFFEKRAIGNRRDIEKKSFGCPLCRLMILALSQQVGDESSLWDDTTICDIYWTLDGRERPETEEEISDKSPRPQQLVKTGRKRRHSVMENSQGTDFSTQGKKCTRRLCVEWRNGPLRSVTAYILLLVQAIPHGELRPDIERRNLFCGRRLDSLTLETTPMIKAWYDLCNEVHKDCRRKHNDKQFASMRSDPTFAVIDLEKMCCTPLPINAKYVALSYTWGAPDDRFVAKNENFGDLRQEYGLRRQEVWDKLPKVIKDAIMLTGKLGFRYLWVDSICIIQDNEESLAENTGRMDILYGNAELTICGADGDGVEVGLIALLNNNNPDTRAKQYIAPYRRDNTALELMLSFAPETYIQRSAWDSRAWTFQERLLSDRLVIFVDGRAYYQCRTTTMSQDICSDDKRARWSIEQHGTPANALTHLERAPLKCYKRCLELYTKRKIRYDGDILRAFNGISNVICDATGSELVWGLLNTHFDLALLWESQDAPVRREPVPLFDIQQKPTGKWSPAFPSWSWCGWKRDEESKNENSMRYSPAMVGGPEENMHEWLMKHTWITYYIIDGGGRLRLVWNPYRQKTCEPKSDDQQGYVARLDGIPTHDTAKSPAYDFYGRPWENFEYDETRGRLLSTDTNPQFYRISDPNHLRLKVLEPHLPATEWKHKSPDKQLLQFWTWSAKFHLREESTEHPFSRALSGFSPPGAGLKRFAIKDRDGDFAGTIVLDKKQAKWNSEEERHEFIAISDAKSFTPDEYNEWNFITELDRNNTQWQLYNVLLLVTDQETGTAYRAGLGKIFHRSFESACREDDGSDSMHWKEIILG